MRYLGIDYGKKKIGLAISEGLTASPLKVLTVSGLSESLDKVRLEITKQQIDKVVIGIPESGEALKIVQEFIKKMKVEIEIIEVPETLTSFNSREMMSLQHLTRKKRQQDDAYAASLILQGYLNDK